MSSIHSVTEHGWVRGVSMLRLHWTWQMSRNDPSFSGLQGNAHFWLSKRAAPTAQALPFGPP